MIYLSQDPNRLAYFAAGIKWANPYGPAFENAGDVGTALRLPERGSIDLGRGVVGLVHYTPESRPARGVIPPPVLRNVGPAPAGDGLASLG